MPYIRPESRKEIDKIVGYAMGWGIRGASIGEINYLITQLLLETHPGNYREYNELVGMLECCKLEFYRRAVAKYEEEKIKENGDVYPEE